MSWIKLDDQWMDHPKIIKAGRDARDMWLASITWCAKHLTDGYFPKDLLTSLAVSAGIDVANCQTFATRLVEVSLWDATSDGYMVHDYLDYNPTKEQALATKSARKEAGRAGGLAKSLANSQQNPSKNVAKVYPVPVPVPVPEIPNNGSGKKDLKGTRKSAPPDASLYPLAEALATVCKMDLESNKGMLFREAKTIKGKLSIEELLQDYGIGGIWYSCDWRGKKGEPPTPALIRQTLGNLNHRSNGKTVIKYDADGNAKEFPA